MRENYRQKERNNGREIKKIGRNKAAKKNRETNKYKLRNVKDVLNIKSNNFCVGINIICFIHSFINGSTALCWALACSSVS
jgi:hypothetical protein